MTDLISKKLRHCTQPSSWPYLDEEEVETILRRTAHEIDHAKVETNPIKHSIHLDSGIDLTGQQRGKDTTRTPRSSQSLRCHLFQSKIDYYT